MMTYNKTKRSSRCTFINKKKAQSAFTVITRMLIKYWQESKVNFQKMIRSEKAAVFFFFLRWPLASDTDTGAPSSAVLSFKNKKKHAQSKAIVYSTSSPQSTNLSRFLRVIPYSDIPAFAVLTSSAMGFFFSLSNNLERFSVESKVQQVRPTAAHWEDTRFFLHWGREVSGEGRGNWNILALRTTQQQQPGGRSRGKL